MIPAKRPVYIDLSHSIKEFTTVNIVAANADVKMICRVFNFAFNFIFDPPLFHTAS